MRHDCGGTVHVWWIRGTVDPTAQAGVVVKLSCDGCECDWMVGSTVDVRGFQRFEYAFPAERGTPIAVPVEAAQA